MSRFALVIFDLDGTLVDSFEDIRRGVVVACRAIGVTATTDLLALSTRGIPLEEFYQRALGAPHDAPGERARFDRFVDAYRAQYLPGCLATTTPYPGIPEALAALRARHPRPRIGVATTKRTETARRVLDGTGLLPLVDVYSGSDGLPHKPDPAILRKVAAEAGVDLARTAMVGDTDKDVLAARAAGCTSVGVTWGGFSAAEIRALAPDHVVHSAHELPGVLA